MPRVVVCGVYPKQILAYLNFQKDCELRKAVPDPELILKKPLEETPIVIKTAGSTYAYLTGFVDEVVRGKPQELWRRYSNVYKFGIDRETFNTYFAGIRTGVIIHFKEIRMIYPPLKGVPASQTYRYVIIPGDRWNLFELTNERIRNKLVELTKKIQAELKERYKFNPSMLKKIV